MIEVKRKIYNKDYPDWVTQCPLCNDEKVDSIINLSSDSLNHIRFAIGQKCIKELANKLLTSWG